MMVLKNLMALCSKCEFHATTTVEATLLNKYSLQRASTSVLYTTLFFLASFESIHCLLNHYHLPWQKRTYPTSNNCRLEGITELLAAASLLLVLLMQRLLNVNEKE
jgi:hypothetical protein